MSHRAGLGAEQQLGSLAKLANELNRERLVIQRCGACARHVFPPRRRCPHCKEDALSFVDASGRGTVHAFTIVSRREERGGAYNVVLVDLEEGVRVMSRVEDAPTGAVRIGLPVRAGFVAAADGPLLVFYMGEA